MRFAPIALSFAVMFALLGCEQRETKPTETTEKTQAVTSASGETTPRASDCEYEPEETRGETCGTPSGATVAGGCDPVMQTGCGEKEHCRFAVELNEARQPARFVRVCSELVCGSRTKWPGESCEPNQCMPGSLCVSGTCKRYCRLSDALGCKSGEFCVAAEMNPEFGYCESTCSE